MQTRLKNNYYKQITVSVLTFCASSWSMQSSDPAESKSSVQDSAELCHSCAAIRVGTLADQELSKFYCAPMHPDTFIKNAIITRLCFAFVLCKHAQEY